MTEDGQWQQREKEPAPPTVRKPTIALVVAIGAALLFGIGGLLMVTVQAAGPNSIFEPLINGLGFMSLGAAAMTLAWVFS